MKKRWHLNTSDRAFAQWMEKICSRDHVHLPITGTNTTVSASYPVNMARRMAKYFLQRPLPEALKYELEQLLLSPLLEEGTNPEEHLDDRWNLLTKEEQRKCEAIVAKLHANMGHASMRTLLLALKKKQVHWSIIAAAQPYHCEACAMAKRKLLAPVSSGIANNPGQVVGTDNFYWTHPSGKRAVRCQIFVDYGSDVAVNKVHLESTDGAGACGNTSAVESRRAFRQCWWRAYGKPQLLRTDPEGCFRSKEHVDGLNDIGVQWDPDPGEA
jgi:hypothetical protein